MEHILKTAMGIRSSKEHLLDLGTLLHSCRVIPNLDPQMFKKGYRCTSRGPAGMEQYSSTVGIGGTLDLITTIEGTSEHLTSDDLMAMRN